MHIKNTKCLSMLKTDASIPNSLFLFIEKKMYNDCYTDL